MAESIPVFPVVSPGISPKILFDVEFPEAVLFAAFLLLSELLDESPKLIP